MVFLVILWLGCAVFGALMGQAKGRAAGGFALGLFLGPLGLVGLALLGPVKAQCPYCRELVDGRAVVCPHCRGQFSRSAD